MVDSWLDLFLVAMPLVLIAWIAMQALAIRRLRGGWRLAAWVPAAAMGAALAIAVLGAAAGSNIAPIWVVFALPLCFAWISLLWLARGLTRLRAG